MLASIFTYFASVNFVRNKCFIFYRLKKNQNILLPDTTDDLESLKSDICRELERAVLGEETCCPLGPGDADCCLVLGDVLWVLTTGVDLTGLSGKSGNGGSFALACLCFGVDGSDSLSLIGLDFFLAGDPLSSSSDKYLGVFLEKYI